MGFPPLSQLGTKPLLAMSLLSQRLSRHLSSYMLMKEKCQILQTPVLGCIRLPSLTRLTGYSDIMPSLCLWPPVQRVLRHPWCSKEAIRHCYWWPRQPPKERCHAALLPITGSQAPQRHSKVREHLFCSPCTFAPPLVTMFITDFTQPAPHLLLWCYLPGSSSIMYSLALPAFTLSHLSPYPLRT